LKNKFVLLVDIFLLQTMILFFLMPLRSYGQLKISDPTQKSGDVLGVVTISSINFRGTIREGVDQSIIDMRGMAHWAGTPKFGESGNSVLAVHRVLKDKRFFRAEDLNIGDEIVIKRNDGAIISYRVYDMFDVDPVKGYNIIYTTNRNVSILTIFTCHPPFSRDRRLIIRARLVRLYANFLPSDKFYSGGLFID